MGVGEAILAIIDILDAVSDIAGWLTPDEINEYTVYDFTGDTWIGYVSYSYEGNENDSGTEGGTCVFSSSSNYDGCVIFSGKHVTVTEHLTGGVGQPSVGVDTAGNISFSGGGAYAFSVEINSNLDPDPWSKSSLGVSFTSGTTFKANGSWTGSASNRIGLATDTTLTNSSKFREKHPDVPYVPPGSYTFDQLRNALIEQYNQDYDLDISIDNPDIPTYNDLFGDGTDPTETGSGSGFEFDYGEVISPSELESILDHTDYQLDELDTELPDLSFELPDAVFSSEQITLLTDTLTASYSFFDGLGLSGTLISLGVLAGLIRLIRGG